MIIDLVVVGKTNISFVEAGQKEYSQRLGRYIKFNTIVLPYIKNGGQLSEAELKEREGEMLCPKLAQYDYIMLLDEGGQQMSSVDFSKWVEAMMVSSTRKLAFVVGGAYGFSSQVYSMARGKLSLSKMTYSHQMIRLLFTEQLYRAFTIINNEPYHHK